MPTSPPCMCAPCTSLLLMIGLVAGAGGGRSESAYFSLGTYMPTGASDPQTPAGFTSAGFEISAPGVTNSAAGFLAVAPHTTANPRGLVTFFTGGPGQGWWSSRPDTQALADDLRAAGFTVAQVRWADSWLRSSPGNDAGTAHLAARPATVIQFIHDNYYLPLGINQSLVDQSGGGFIITGNSGGASQVSYTLSHYGMEGILDAVIPTGGPPHAVLAKSLLNNPGEEHYQYPLETRQFIDEGFGYFDGDGPGALQDPTFLPRWLEESVATGGNDYSHPDTRVHFIIGANDPKMQTVAGDYHDRLLDAGSPLLTWEIVPGTPHSIVNTPQGRAALFAAITAAPVLLAGDMNCDGVVTVSDIGRFVLALTNPAAYAAQFPDCDINNGDMNDDGSVSVSDIGLFVQALTGA